LAQTILWKLKGALAPGTTGLILLKFLDIEIPNPMVVFSDKYKKEHDQHFFIGGIPKKKHV